ncbi:MAG: helix-turn-helix domain-containing protein [Parcubacteria group bacterium]
MLQKKLQQLGFEEKEATLYAALLELGEAGVVDIARKSGLKRTTVYHILDNLKLRGLVSQTKKGKRVIYLAEDPHSIGEDLKEKEKLFQKTLPELLSIANLMEKKPIIRYFEGLNGIKEVYKDELKQSNSELLCWWAESYEIFGDAFVIDYYMPERIKRKIWNRSIVPKSEYALYHKRFDQESLRQIRIAPLDPIFAELELSLYANNKTSIKSFQEKFALIIESKALYNTLKNIFELQWKGLK